MRFPLYTLIAPVVSSVILWLVTGSPFVLLFAAMGPLMAAANYLDARRTSRLQQATLAESEQLAQANSEHARRQNEQDALAEALAAHPPISAIANAGELVRPPWCVGAQLGDDRVVRVGIDVMTGHPVLIDAAAGVAIVGSGLVITSAARSVRTALHWGWGSSPSETASMAALAQTYSSFGMVSPRMRWVVEMGADGTAGLTDVANPTAVPKRIHADLLTQAEEQLITAKIALNLGQLSGSQGASLSVSGLDLGVNGPHAVVAGTTGSGKTEFVVAWLLEMMQTHTPQQLNVLVLDFKGGLGFARLAAFPHVVGIVTDLTPALAQRALRSLRAEIRYRERVLATHGVTDATGLTAAVLPRLVIVADEYRALLEATPEAAAVFIDLTSRGRALGIHVILTTQHTGGVLADAILANCALRVCFRVTNSHDSRTLLGDDRATQLPHNPGRAIVMGNHLPVQSLTVEATDAQRLAAAATAAQAWVAAHPEHSMRRPWLDPLPATLAWDELASTAQAVAQHSAADVAAPARAEPSNTAPALVFGLCDDPDNQTQPIAHWQPLVDGHLLIAGPLGSGRTAALGAIACAAAQVGLVTTLAADAHRAWDAVMTPPPSGLILLDNLDSILAAMSHEHRDAFIQAVQALLREGSARGIHVALATLDHGAVFAQLQPLMRTRLELRSVGFASWQGLDTRVALAAAVREACAPKVACMRWLPSANYIVVTHRPQHFARRVPAEAAHKIVLLRPGLAPGSEPALYVGDVDDWQSAFTLLASLKSTAHMVFDGCTPSEVRTLRLFRGLLPHTEAALAVHVTPEGETQRVQLGDARERDEQPEREHAA